MHALIHMHYAMIRIRYATCIITYVHHEILYICITHYFINASRIITKMHHAFTQIPNELIHLHHA